MIASDEVVISSAGRVTDQLIDGVDQSPAATAFTYDNAGRLTKAIPATGTTIDYSFETSPTNWNCAFPSAGMNGNRTSKTVNGTLTAYCYDTADRMTWTGTTSPTYDNHGRTITFNGKTFGWSARSEHTSTSWAGTAMTYERDGFGRIIKRTQTGQSDLWYRYGNSSDSSTYTATAAAPNGGTVTVKDQQLSLPGGVSLSRNTTTGAQGFSLPNKHGSLLAVVDQTGTKQGPTYKWDPNGSPVAGTTQPDLLNGNMENGWFAQYNRPVMACSNKVRNGNSGKGVAFVALDAVSLGTASLIRRESMFLSWIIDAQSCQMSWYDWLCSQDPECA